MLEVIFILGAMAALTFLGWTFGYATGYNYGQAAELERQMRE